MAVFLRLLVAIFILESDISCELLDESRCSNFHYEYRVLERIIYLEHKHGDLERNNEDLIDTVKQLKLVMEEKNKELEQNHMELKLALDKSNTTESELKLQYGIQASAIEELQRTKEVQDEVLEELKKDLQEKDEIVNKLAAGLHSHLEEVGNGSLIRKPTVGFTARLSSSHKYTGPQAIVFNSVVSNIGGGYNPETGKFTAPTDGQYIFSMTIFTYQRYVYVQMLKNEEQISHIYPDGRDASDPYETASDTVVVNMNSGDIVYVKYSGSAGLWSYDLHGSNYCTFSGVLIR